MNKELIKAAGRNCKSCAFTIAEVLITLGIIGVVAALTIPTLIGKYQEQVTVNKVKKFYSLISQAVLMEIAENGPVSEWGLPTAETTDGTVELVNHIKKHLKIAKDCGLESGCLGYTENVRLLKGDLHSQNYETSPNYYKLILTDGSYILIRARGKVSEGNIICTETESNVNDICATIGIDINGGKAPNTIGKDIFDFYITKNGTHTRMDDSSCNIENGSGWGCTNLVITNGNMDYLHK